MADDTPLRPSLAAQVAHGLCMAISDLLQQEGGEVSRRTYMKMSALAMAAEMYARETAHFLGGQFGEGEAALERLEDEWVSR